MTLPTMTMSRLIAPALGSALAASMVLTGCSGDDSPSAEPSSSGSTSSSASAPTSESSPSSASASPYLPVPAGVDLTAPGTRLAVGDNAVVAYKPRQDQVGALDIDVTGLEQTTIKRSFSAWQLSDAQQKSTPYFVRATVKNVGDSDLGGRQVPLYVVNEDDVLLESTPFASAFKPCPSTPLPKRFRSGDRAKVCLVYLAPEHGQLVAVSFRPEETFNPITWTGKIQTPEPEQKKNGKGEKNGG